MESILASPPQKEDGQALRYQTFFRTPTILSLLRHVTHSLRRTAVVSTNLNIQAYPTGLLSGLYSSIQSGPTKGIDEGSRTIYPEIPVPQV